MTQPGLRTEIATSDLHHIWVRGLDLTSDVMGRLTFTEVVFLLIASRLPTPEEMRVLDAVLVSLMEHGLTPSATVARVTYSVSPESLQGAVAAGLLGAGSVVLGSMEECGRILTQVDEAVTRGRPLAEVLEEVVLDYRRQHRRLPGMGHAIHTEGDPRTARLFEIAKECGFSGRHVAAVQALAKAAESASGRSLPINATGAIAAVLLEVGVPWQLHRGFALISRTAGLVAHIGEELEAPITPTLRKLIREGESPAGNSTKGG
jgi:citrate synthase